MDVMVYGFLILSTLYLILVIDGWESPIWKINDPFIRMMMYDGDLMYGDGGIDGNWMKE